MNKKKLEELKWESLTIQIATHKGQNKVEITKQAFIDAFKKLGIELTILDEE
jgi:hypothetical protein